MKRFYLYEGNQAIGHEESCSFDTRREAIIKAKFAIEEIKHTTVPTGYGYRINVIDRKTGEFIYTEEV